MSRRFRKPQGTSFNFRQLVDQPMKKVILHEGVEYDIRRFFHQGLHAFAWQVTGITDRGSDRLWNTHEIPAAVRSYVEYLEGSSP